MREIQQLGPQSREWTTGHPALAIAGITLAGISHASKGFDFRTDGWAFGQLLICFGGEGRVRIRDRWCKCGKGSVYVNPPGVPHAYQALGATPWKLCWLVYQDPFQQTPLAGITEAALISTDPWPLRSAIACFRRESIGRADPVLMRYWVDLIHLLAMRVTQEAHGDDRLWRIWEKVRANIDRHWTVAELAEIVDLSEEHLRRLCHERLGRTPMEHVTQLRMLRAAVLLRSGEQKIEGVAEQVGYADRFGFSAAFRRHIGLSPAQYRRQHGADGTHASTPRSPT